MVKKIVLYAVLIILMIICLYPFLYIINISLSDSHEVTNGAVYLIPKGINFNAFKVIFRTSTIWRGYFNSLLYVTVGTVMTILLCSSAGYVLSVKDYKYRKVIMAYFAVTMFFSGGIIPTFLVIRSLGLIDSIWAVTIPGALSAWTIILFRTNFKYIPKDIIDSARIDGAGHFWIYARIIMPLSKSIIATLGLFTIVAYWNSYFPALMYLTSDYKQPLMIILRKLVITDNVRGEMESIIGSAIKADMNGIGFSRSIKMASMLLSLGPIIFIYPMIQKYFERGVLVGSIKE